MATVSRRCGKWVAEYRDGTGRRHWETYETRRAAENALAQNVTAVREGCYVSPNEKRTVRETFEMTIAAACLCGFRRRRSIGSPGEYMLNPYGRRAS
jgi:predicted aminopeptidase